MYQHVFDNIHSTLASAEFLTYLVVSYFIHITPLLVLVRKNRYAELFSILKLTHVTYLASLTFILLPFSCFILFQLMYKAFAIPANDANDTIESEGSSR